jgi:hypothetical protein
MEGGVEIRVEEEIAKTGFSQTARNCAFSGEEWEWAPLCEGFVLGIQ